MENAFQKAKNAAPKRNPFSLQIARLREIGIVSPTEFFRGLSKKTILDYIKNWDLFLSYARRWDRNSELSWLDRLAWSMDLAEEDAIGFRSQLERGLLRPTPDPGPDGFTPFPIPLAPRSVNTIVSSLRSIYKRLHLHCNIPNIFEPVCCTRNGGIDRRRVTRVNSGDVSRILENIPDKKDHLNILRDRLIIQTLFTSGLRRMELLNLRWRNFKITAKGVGIHLEISKGMRNMDRGIAPETYQDLLRYKTEIRQRFCLSEASMEDLWVFPSKWELRKRANGKLKLLFHPKQMAESTLYNLVREYGREALGKDISPHLLRHAAGTSLARKKVHPKYIQEFLGHSHPATTDIYIDVSEEMPQEAAKELGKLI